jgi:hypothetical protein
VEGLIDQYVQLDGDLVRTVDRSRQLQTYSFEIPVNQAIVMEVDQPLGDVDQLEYLKSSPDRGKRGFKLGAYKLGPLCFRVRLDELIDVSVWHPFGYHYQLVFCHHHSHQWQDIWMSKGFPHNGLLAEFLRRAL